MPFYRQRLEGISWSLVSWTCGKRSRAGARRYERFVEMTSLQKRVFQARITKFPQAIRFVYSALTNVRSQGELLSFSAEQETLKCPDNTICQHVTTICQFPFPKTSLLKPLRILQLNHLLEAYSCDSPSHLLELILFRRQSYHQ